MERQGKSWNAKGSLFSVDNLRAGLGQIARNMIEEIPSLYHHSPHVAQKGKVCGHALEVSYGPAPNAAKQTEDIRGSVNRLVILRQDSFVSDALGPMFRLSRASEKDGIEPR